MQSYSSTFNRPPAVVFSANAELKSHGSPSSHATTLWRHRIRPVYSIDIAKVNTFMLQVPVCKWKEMTELSRNDTLFASPPSSPPSTSKRLSSLPSVMTLRIPGSTFLLSQREGLEGSGQHHNSCWMQPGSDNLIVFRLVFHAIQVRVLDALKKQYVQRFSEGRRGLIALIVAIICLTCPTFVVTADISIVISNDVALAQSIGQIRQAALFLERIGESTSAKVLDKVVTVISGQTVVTPETVDKLKSIIESEKDPRDWQTDLANNADTLWSTTVDVISQFDPISLLEATGNGIQGLGEAAAERFAAFELSTLVALGERWVLWTPFVILPMYWQMTRNKKNEENDGGNRGISQAMVVELSEAAVAKAARVRDELERIELKASLLDLVYSLGKLAWRASGRDQDLKRRQIDELLTRLQDLNPTSSRDLGSALVKAPSAESPYTEPLMDVDGDWNLIYVSQDSSQGEQTQFAQLLSLNIPGFELSNMQQKLWRQGAKTALSTSESRAELLVAKNTAQVRLGPLGVVEISVQGSWENQSDGKSALVSFDTFSAKPVEVLGSRVREDLPPLDLAIPSTLQTSGEWKTVYLDNSLRVNRGRTGQFFLFRKSQ
ncbi:hypothetical protein GOP47_0024856 [Adiantum capillus-veneris]|uniref:Plastid lipid-associated protein/fibrillin conserved domain-containing protein n=1 Tax=Adiantum capillus-veneris TaxID=13818 RepID=A0A9D4U568_ADICA|nr:hypothetical protein GOP47_0024856 [Adiantum capillus-veneris]